MSSNETAVAGNITHLLAKEVDPLVAAIAREQNRV